MKYFPLIIFFFVLAPHCRASHIVGGEITLTYINDPVKNYIISVNFYFDLDHGNRYAQDDYAFVGLYDKETNKLLDTIQVPLRDYEDIDTKDSICNYIRLKTRRILYATSVYLDPNIYSGSQGFYAVWERCCRNETIVNIINPDSAATAFYGEFPPIKGFVNSSPQFKTPSKNGYACVGSNFYLDFGATSVSGDSLVTDVNGDSLVYELAVPLNGHLYGSTENNWPAPAPYDEVKLLPGFSLDSLIPGNPPLRVNSKTGAISFKSYEPGTYVFSVKCIEFRNGKYLGHIRRDYQISVISCVENTKPVLEAIDPITGTVLTSSDTINIDGRYENCITTRAMDTLKGQRFTLYSRGLGFDVVSTISPDFFITKSKKDTAYMSTCLPSCMKFNSKFKSFMLILGNENNCKLPKYDSVFIKLKNTHVPSQPVISSTLADNNINVTVGAPISFTVTGTGNEGNKVYLNGASTPRRIPAVTLKGFEALSSVVELQSTCEDINLSPISYCFHMKDSSCYMKKEQDLCISITISDSLFASFQAPNVFTPNGDTKNDYFEIPNLPKNNCSEQFSEIEIYNRWGNKIYENHDKAFKWDGKEIQDGLYFYIVKYTKQNFKGWIELIR